VKGITYKDSGVDIGKAERLIGDLKQRIERTFNPHVLSPIGGFASLVEVPPSYRRPIIVTSTDGVGTKLRIAFLAGKHDTVGIDLVAMSVNDILTIGARPLSFLDYFATGRIDDAIYRDVLAGICAGCEMAGCALAGGETAEMPSFYEEGEYELAGFVTGIVEKELIIDGRSIASGDRIIGLASSGLHSNGFSLVRKVLFDVHGCNLNEELEGLGNQPLVEELLRPTRIYVKSVLSILEHHAVKGMAHITGGGLPGNISRIIPEGLTVDISLQQEEIPAIFHVIERMGNVPVDDMIATFNMGVGFVLIVPGSDEAAVLQELNALGEKAFPIGSVRGASGGPKVAVSRSRL
jgi:phosphoribosylformylglycinamidine cyclo-ligase